MHFIIFCSDRFAVLRPPGWNPRSSGLGGGREVTLTSDRVIPFPQAVIGTVTKMSPKISEETGKDGKYRKGWKGKLLRKIKKLSRIAGRNPTERNPQFGTLKAATRVQIPLGMPEKSKGRRIYSPSAVCGDDQNLINC